MVVYLENDSRRQAVQVGKLTKLEERGNNQHNKWGKIANEIAYTPMSPYFEFSHMFLITIPSVWLPKVKRRLDLFKLLKTFVRALHFGTFTNWPHIRLLFINNFLFYIYLYLSIYLTMYLSIYLASYVYVCTTAGCFIIMIPVHSNNSLIWLNTYMLFYPVVIFW